jgi:hypothetical protein
MPTVIEVSVLAIILVTYLMILLDESVMIAALRRIRTSLGFSATGLSWVQSAYTLAFGGLLLLGARAGDILGRRRMYMTGLAIFTAASMVAGLAQSTAWLLAARALQGVGAAILAPSTLALLTTSFSEGTERTRADVRGHRQHWHQHRTRSRRHPHGCALLALRVLRQGPIGVPLMPTAPRYLAETERRPARLDPAGAISSTLGMTAFVYGIVRSAATGWSDLARLEH